MPSSPDLPTDLSIDLPTDLSTVRGWHPRTLTADTLPVTEIRLPAFEVEQAATPAIRSFALSGPAAIPAQLLASATASARAAGYAEGWASGMADARTATEARLAAESAAAERTAAERQSAAERALTALLDAANGLERRAAPAARDIEEQIVAAAWAIAQALVGEVLADDDRRSRAAVTRALSLAPADEDVVVSVSEVDFAVLRVADTGTTADRSPDGWSPGGEVSGMTAPAVRAPSGAAEPIRRQRGLRTVTIMPDPALAPGDAIASCGATTIDARLSTALQRVTEVLAP